MKHAVKTNIFEEKKSLLNVEMWQNWSKYKTRILANFNEQYVEIHIW